jgi:DNA-binding response OmpR family regulator
MASPASFNPACSSACSPAQILLAALVARQGRVVTRTELAREIGLRTDQTRRVDAMLVEVRRELTTRGLELVNVRSRGWMISATNS